MIQKCPRTDGARHERHNNIVKIFERELEGRGYSTNVEPRIPTNDGLKIPVLYVANCPRKHRKTKLNCNCLYVQLERG